MPANNILSDMLTTIFNRRPFSCKVKVSGLQLASAILEKYRALVGAQTIEFFTFLNEEFDLDLSRSSCATITNSSIS